MQVPSPHSWALERVAAVCADRNVALTDFYGRGRGIETVRTRALLAYLLREVPGPGGQRLSFPEITTVMGRGNHSTTITQHHRVTGDPELLTEAMLTAERLNLRRRAKAPMPMDSDSILINGRVYRAFLELTGDLTDGKHGEELRGRALAVLDAARPQIRVAGAA